MANNVEFHDYTVQVKAEMDNRINAALEECAGEVISQTNRNSRAKTGKTRNSFRHKVDDEAHIAYMGSNDENAIWEEFGTGEYALKGNGRKGGWTYRDAEGEWHHTYGKKPSRAFWKAFTSLKNHIIKRIEEFIRGL